MPEITERVLQGYPVEDYPGPPGMFSYRVGWYRLFDPVIGREGEIIERFTKHEPASPTADSVIECELIRRRPNEDDIVLVKAAMAARNFV